MLIATRVSPRHGRNWLVGLLALGLWGCCAAPPQPDAKVNDTLGIVARVDTRLRDDESYAAYVSRVDSEIRVALARLDSPELLHAFIVECNDRLSTGENQRDLQEVNVHLHALSLALRKLGECKSDEAARLLVSLLGDERFSWDGETALTLGAAIVLCGPACLPHLRRVAAPEKKGLADTLSQHIQEGVPFP